METNAKKYRRIAIMFSTWSLFIHKFGPFCIYRVICKLWIMRIILLLLCPLSCILVSAKENEGQWTAPSEIDSQNVCIAFRKDFDVKGRQEDDVLWKGLSGRCVPDERTVQYVRPSRVVWVSDTDGQGVRNPENLLRDVPGQVTVASSDHCVLSTRRTGQAGILLDFGKELHGGLQIITGMRPSNRPLRVRIRFGESVTEAMSEISPESSATNDHAMRDFEIGLPWLGSLEVGDTGFRFVRIDLLDKDEELSLHSVRAAFKFRDIPYLGSFRSDNERLDRIWETGAYTVHLNMQSYLWDGIKRDRLVWVGDMHPEVMTINSVFGANDVVYRSLDVAKDDTPLPGWMNGMCSYSLWWILIQRDLYLYQGNKEYLKSQHGYLSDLLGQVIGSIDGNRENLQGGVRFLDWPTSESPETIHAGLQALMVMALEAGSELALWLEDGELSRRCEGALRCLRRYVPDHNGNKQAAALLALSGLCKAKDMDRIISAGGADGFSTFFGYYMLEAMALAGDYEGAMRIISDYWGGMLDLGATTFWEDLDFSDLSSAGRIDDFVPSGKSDIHSMGGNYCYKGLRHSLCHGWASGPTAWMSRHVLGIVPLEPGCRKVRIEPHLGSLQRVEGTFPTPYGIIRVKHCRTENGKTVSEVDAPEEITVVR